MAAVGLSCNSDQMLGVVAALPETAPRGRGGPRNTVSLWGPSHLPRGAALRAGQGSPTSACISDDSGLVCVNLE